MRDSAFPCWRRWRGARWWWPPRPHPYPRSAVTRLFTSTMPPIRSRSRRCSRSRLATSSSESHSPGPPASERASSPGSAAPPAWRPSSKSSSSSCDRSVERVPGEGRGACPAELRGAQDAPPFQVGGKVGVADHLLERFSPRIRLVRGHDEAGAVDHLGKARTIGNHNRGAACHRFERRQAEALVPPPV